MRQCKQSASDDKSHAVEGCSVTLRQHLPQKQTCIPNIQHHQILQDKLCVLKGLPENSFWCVSCCGHKSKCSSHQCPDEICHDYKHVAAAAVNITCTLRIKDMTGSCMMHVVVSNWEWVTRRMCSVPQFQAPGALLLVPNP